MRKVIIFMALMKEVSFILGLHLKNPEVFYNVFKENKNCISVTESNKLSPGTKNIAIRYNQF